MDWFQLLILVIFFLFPLIQQGIEASRRSREPEVMTEGEEDEELYWEDEGAEVRTGPQARSRAGEDDEEWSAGWLDWPSPEGEREPAEPIPDRMERRPEPVSEGRRAPRAERSRDSTDDDRSPADRSAGMVAPAPAPARAPVPDLGSRVEEAARARPAASSPPKVPASPRPGGIAEGADLTPIREGGRELLSARGPTPPRVRGRTRGASPLEGALATRSSLRRAVVLNEVLGPPIALRPRGERIA